MTAAAGFPLSSARPTRRVWSLAQAEALLLWRNRTALVNALVMPLATVFLLKSSGAFDRSGTPGTGASLVTSLAAFTLILVVYYNLVTALVGRREELVLKRLRTGELSDAEILAGTATPAIALAWAQVAVGGVAAGAVFGMGAPVNAGLVLAALVLGTAVFVLLAAASTAVTRNVEMAQVTTMPVVFVPLALSGLLIPLDALPPALERVAQVMPLTPVVDLLSLGLAGVTADGRSVDFVGSLAPAAGPLAVLTGWLVLGAWATRRWMRWEPRR